MEKQTKYIFVTGGVVSSLGKGITAASLGTLLKARGLKVNLQKCDPYINVDPGTMSPYQHGEVFVTDDGAETDLDIGHYERFTDENSFKDSNVTTGKVYQTVINKERRGEYLGGTVQVIPHITNEIKDRIYSVGKMGNPDVVITEIGGTVGDIESQPFLEAIRQIRWDVGKNNCLFIHVTFVPYLAKVGETKTKPTQHSVKELRSLGIEPDIIVCRTEQALSKDVKSKISLFCNVCAENVISNTDASSLYAVPLMLKDQKLDDIVCNSLSLETPAPDLAEWTQIVEKEAGLTETVTVALVGKYTELKDAYLSIVESFNHAGIFNNINVNIRWIEAIDLEQGKSAATLFEGVSGILVPGGFGERGIEGKIEAVRYARENKIPYFGICLGMHMAVIEFARNVAGLEGAHSSEQDPKTPHPVIDLLPEQPNISEMEGTMRLGAYGCKIAPGTKTAQAYGEDMISERHRHRYEFNNSYLDIFKKNGMIIAGLNPDKDLVEIIEIEDHPWFVGVQFHPEFKSRPLRPQPLFREFIGAAKAYQKKH